MSRDINSQIRDYAGVCASLAEQYARSRSARRVGAEYDDLYQEALISVWQALARGVGVSKEQIENRLRSWLRFLSRQNPYPYETLLPLDDYRAGAG